MNSLALSSIYEIFWSYAVLRLLAFCSWQESSWFFPNPFMMLTLSFRCRSQPYNFFNFYQSGIFLKSTIFCHLWSTQVFPSSVNYPFGIHLQWKKDKICPLCVPYSFCSWTEDSRGPCWYCTLPVSASKTMSS